MHMSRKAPPKSTTLHSNLPSYYRNPASAGARPETAANDNCRVMASGPGSRSGCATTHPASARTPPPPRGEHWQDHAAIDSEQVDEPRAQLRALAAGQALHLPAPRHPRVARLELHATVSRHGGFGPARHIGVIGLGRSQAGSSLLTRRSSATPKTEGRWVELRAVLEHLQATAKRSPHRGSGGRLGRRRARAASRCAAARAASSAWSASTGRGPPRRAAIRERGRRGRKRRRSRLHDRGKLLLDLAAEPAQPRVTQNRYRACGGAGLGRKEMQLQPCGPRSEADVAVGVKLASILVVA